MDYLTIILITAAALAVIGLAFMSGWELGHANGTDQERDLANRRVNGLLNELNKYKPRATRKRRAAK